MPSSKDTFHDLLKTAGCSVTAARRTVFETLLGQEPLGMHELVERAHTANRASVYRAVELFERLGIVQRLHTGWKYKIELTDKFTDHHHHLTCLRCGKTDPISEQLLEGFIDTMAKEQGFIPVTHQVEIQGYCAQCRDT